MKTKLFFLLIIIVAVRTIGHAAVTRDTNYYIANITSDNALKITFIFIEGLDYNLCISETTRYRLRLPLVGNPLTGGASCYKIHDRTTRRTSGRFNLTEISFQSVQIILNTEFLDQDLYMQTSALINSGLIHQKFNNNSNLVFTSSQISKVSVDILGRPFNKLKNLIDNYSVDIGTLSNNRHVIDIY